MNDRRVLIRLDYGEPISLDELHSAAASAALLGGIDEPELEDITVALYPEIAVDENGNPIYDPSTGATIALCFEGSDS